MTATATMTTDMYGAPQTILINGEAADVPTAVGVCELSEVRVSHTLTRMGYRLTDPQRDAEGPDVNGHYEFEVEPIDLDWLLSQPDVRDAVETLAARGVTAELYAELLAGSV